MSRGWTRAYSIQRCAPASPVWQRRWTPKPTDPDRHTNTWHIGRLYWCYHKSLILSSLRQLPCECYKCERKVHLWNKSTEACNKGLVLTNIIIHRSAGTIIWSLQKNAFLKENNTLANRRFTQSVIFHEFLQLVWNSFISDCGVGSRKSHSWVSNGTPWLKLNS